MTSVNSSARKQYVSVADITMVPHDGLKCGKSPAPFYHRIRVLSSFFPDPCEYYIKNCPPKRAAVDA